MDNSKIGTIENGAVFALPFPYAVLPASVKLMSSNISNPWLNSPALHRLPKCNSSNCMVSLAEMGTSGLLFPVLSFSFNYRPSGPSTTESYPVYATNLSLPSTYRFPTLNTNPPRVVYPTSASNSVRPDNVSASFAGPLLNSSEPVLIELSSNITELDQETELDGLYANVDSRIPATVTDMDIEEENNNFTNNKIISNTNCGVTIESHTYDGLIRMSSDDLGRTLTKLSDSEYFQSREDVSRENEVSFMNKSLSTNYLCPIFEKQVLPASGLVSQCSELVCSQISTCDHVRSSDASEVSNLNTEDANSVSIKHDPLLSMVSVSLGYSNSLPYVSYSSYLTGSNSASIGAAIASSNEQKSLRLNLQEFIAVAPANHEILQSEVNCNAKDKHMIDQNNINAGLLGTESRGNITDAVERIRNSIENENDNEHSIDNKLSKLFDGRMYSMKQLNSNMQIHSYAMAPESNHNTIDKSMPRCSIPAENMPTKISKPYRNIQRVLNTVIRHHDAGTVQTRINNVCRNPQRVINTIEHTPSDTYTRREKSQGKSGGRLLLKDWLIQQVELNYIQGLNWLDADKRTLLKIPWIHGSKNGWMPECHSLLFERWAIHSGKYRPDKDNPNHKKWKANFRCALNSLPDVKEVPQLSRKNGTNGFKVYEISEGESLNPVRSIKHRNSGGRVKLDRGPKDVVADRIVCDDGIIYEAVSSDNGDGSDTNAEDEPVNKYPVFVANKNSVCSSSGSRSSSRTSSLGSEGKMDIEFSDNNYIKNEPDNDYNKIPTPAVDLAMNTTKYQINGSNQKNRKRRKLKHFGVRTDSKISTNNFLMLQKERSAFHTDKYTSALLVDLSKKENRATQKLEVSKRNFDSGSAVYEEVVTSSSNKTRPVPAGACLHELDESRSENGYKIISKPLDEPSTSCPDDDYDENSDSNDSDEDNTAEADEVTAALKSITHNEVTSEIPVYTTLENMDISNNEEVTVTEETFENDGESKFPVSLRQGILLNIDYVTNESSYRNGSLEVADQSRSQNDGIPTCVKDLEEDDDDIEQKQQ